MIPSQFRVDVFEELSEFGKPELYTIDLVVKELEKLATRRGKQASHARMGLERLKQEGVKMIFSGSSVADAALLRIAKEKHLIVCTQDRALIKRLKSKKISVVTLRQKRYLVRKWW